jgi:MATE family multidrug resistance protein
VYILFTIKSKILGNLSQICIPIVSLTFCGQLGVNELEGAGLASSFFNVFATVNYYGMASACDTLFPQLYGGKDRKKMGIVLQKALIVGFVSMFFSGSLLLACKWLLYLYVKEDKVIQYAF